MDLNLGYTNAILKYGLEKKLLRNELAYVLATAYWETGRTMKPVKEAYWLSEDWRKKNLRYYPWYGRGFVQLTWEANYKKAGDKLGVDLIKNKDLALDPDIAAKILVDGMIEGWFTGKKLSDYITLKKSDFVEARRIINGVDKKNEIADIAKQYDADLKRVGYGVETPVKPTEKPVESVPASSSGSTAEKEPTNLLEVIIELLKAIFGGKNG